MNKKEISIIKKKALEDKVPIIMDDTLEVIAKILDEIKPKKILEIGTAVGYSAICFSEYLQENGKIDTIERDTERVKEATFKAVSTLIKDKYSISWKNIETTNDENGRPSVKFISLTKEVEKELAKIESIDVSISHLEKYAVATVNILF